MKRPTSIPGWISLLDARVRRIELARRVSIGQYVLSVNAANQLIATNTATGTVTVVAVP